MHFLTARASFDESAPSLAAALIVNLAGSDDEPARVDDWLAAATELPEP